MTAKNHTDKMFMDGGVQARQGIQMLCKKLCPHIFL